MYKNFFILLILITLTIFIAGCNSKKKEELRAQNKLLVIANLIDKNALNDAKIKIDSFHLNFPKLVEKRRIAAALEDTINRRECSRTILYCDSLHPIKKHEFDSIVKNFRFEKDSAYQQYGNYVHKFQITEQNSKRNYLKCIVNENAGLQLISNYSGTKIGHKWIEVRNGDVYATTDTTNNSKSHEHYYNIGVDNFERVIFENESAVAVVEFIYNNRTSRIKVMLGGKKSLVYFLESIDAKSIADSYHLWIVKKDILQLEKEIQKATHKIQKINFRKKQHN
ncbi:MAG: hypothetical protein Q7U47_00280 [Paludibacter sp.]|nr:hypothetical protein [Paludibacter sp.]